MNESSTSTTLPWTLYEHWLVKLYCKSEKLEKYLWTANYPWLLQGKWLYMLLCWLGRSRVQIFSLTSKENQGFSLFETQLSETILNFLWEHECALTAFLFNLRETESLRFSSAVSVLLAVVFVAICMGMAISAFIQGKTERPRLFPLVNGRGLFFELFTAVPVIVTAFTFHFNGK